VWREDSPSSSVSSHFKASAGYLLGSYRIATAPGPNSSRLTSFKSIGFNSPANIHRRVDTPVIEKGDTSN
jgi:hypothetical protein